MLATKNKLPRFTHPAKANLIQLNLDSSGRQVYYLICLHCSTVLGAVMEARKRERDLASAFNSREKSPSAGAGLFNFYILHPPPPPFADLLSRLGASSGASVRIRAKPSMRSI